MTSLPPELRALVESGPMCHLTTINADGSPQVSVVWAGLAGDELLTGHMNRYLKLRNIERDPRVVLSFDTPRTPGVVMNEYAALSCRARIEETDAAWDLLDDLTKVYVGPGETFNAPRGPGFIVHYAVEKITGVGPWVPPKS